MNIRMAAVWIRPVVVSAVVALAGIFFQVQSCPAVTMSTGDLNSWYAGLEISGFSVDSAGGDRTTGQTFLISDGNALVSDISFPIYSFSSPMQFQVGVALWNGSEISGPLLYLSEIQTATAGGWQLFTVDPANLTLNQDQKYILFFTSDGFVNSGVNYSADMGYVPSGDYTDEQAFFVAGYKLGNDDLSQQPWIADGGNLAFNINYQTAPNQTVPDGPNTLILLCISSLTVGLSSRFHRGAAADRSAWDLDAQKRFLDFPARMSDTGLAPASRRFD